ncbi:MAG TPA: RND family transporter [Myxococcales bacterium]|nr:RND family transporter [Myxococcales bacterium]HIM03198.1 RND family transporter [Myxococcales bacterium]
MHARIEALLENWGHFVYRRAWWILVLALAMTAGTATQLKHFYIETSLEAFFHQDDPVRVIYDEFREQYGRDTFILIALEPNTPIFEREFLETLRDLHERLENEVPLVVEVTSLVNARITRGEGDELVVGELMEDWPEDDAALRAIESRARANPLYQNNLISGDGKLTSIMVELEVYSQLGGEGDALDGFADGGDPGSEDEDEPVTYLTGAEEAEVIDAVLAMLEEYRSDDLTIEVAGTPVLSNQMALKMQSDMGRFTALALLIIVISLATLFRRVGAVLVPLVTVICSVISTMSIMAGTGTPLTSPTQIIPTFLLAVGVGGSVHIMTIYYQGRRRGLTKEDGLAHALGHSGLAVIMTSLTTAGGLLSFVAAELLPISHFGVFAPIGVMVSLFYTLTMLPALIAISPGRSRAQAEAKSLFFTQRLLIDAGVFSTRHSTPILVATFVLVVVSVYGASMIRVAHSPFDWFPEGDMVRRGMETMDTNMGGMGNIELIVDTGRVNGFHDPAFLESADRLRDYIYTLDIHDVRAGKVQSLTDVLKETHRALNENRSEYYAIPEDPNLVAQELLLFENAGSDDVENLVDSTFQSGRITVRVPMNDAMAFPPFIHAVVEEAERVFGAEVVIRVSGIVHVIGATMTAVVQTMLRSYAMALAIITPLMVLLIGNVRVGLLAMIPNLTPILLTLGIMGWADIPLDVFTLLIGSVAMGLAVDDTIHFMHNFRRYFDEHANVEIAVRKTLETTGQALLFTSIVLALGFAIYTQAYLTNLFYFGLLTALTIVFAFLADIVLAPALLVKVFGRR